MSAWLLNRLLYRTGELFHNGVVDVGIHQIDNRLDTGLGLAEIGIGVRFWRDWRACKVGQRQRIAGIADRRQLPIEPRIGGPDEIFVDSEKYHHEHAQDDSNPFQNLLHGKNPFVQLKHRLSRRAFENPLGGNDDPPKGPA